MLGLGFGLGFVRDGGLKPVFSAFEKSTPDATLYSGEEGMVVIDSTTTTPYTRTNYETIFSFYTNNNNRFELFHRDTETFQIIITVGGVSQTAEIINTINGTFLPNRQRFVVRWKDGSLQIYMNGEEIYYVESGLSFPDTVSNVYLAQRVADLQGTIEYVALYDTGSTEAFARSLSKNSTDIIPTITYDNTRRGVVFAGQSNSVGVASTGSHTYTNTNKLLTNSGDYEDYSDPADDDTDTVILSSVLSDTAALGYQGLVVDALKTADSDFEWFAVPAAKGNTEIADWVPYITSFTVADRVIAQRFHALVNRALMAKQAGTLTYTVWHQGESDAIAGTSKEDYKAAVLELFTEYRKVVGDHPIVIVSLHRWVTALDTTHSATQANWSAIQEAQKELAASVPWMAFVDISDIEATQDDGLHLAQAEQAIIAPRIEAAINSFTSDGISIYGIGHDFTEVASTIGVSTTRTSQAVYIDSDGEWALSAASEPIYERTFGGGELNGLLSQVDRTNKIEYARPSADAVTDHFDTGSGSVTVVTDATAPFNSSFTNNDQVWEVAASGSDVTIEWAGAVGNTNAHNTQLTYKVVSGSDELYATLSIGGEGEEYLLAREWAWASKLDITPASSSDKMRLVVPDGMTIHFAMADMQEEDGYTGSKYLPHLTFPIDTAGASASRGDEIVSVTNFGELDDVGAFYVRSIMWGGDTGQDGWALANSSNPANNAIAKRVTDTGDDKVSFVSGGSSDFTYNYGIRSKTPRYDSTLITWDEDTMLVYDKGELQFTNDISASPIGLDTFYLRDTTNSSLRTSMVLHELKVFNDTLTNEQGLEKSIGSNKTVYLLGPQSNINKIMLYPNTNIVFRGDGEVAFYNEARKYVSDFMLTSLYDPRIQGGSAMLKRNRQLDPNAASLNTYLWDEDEDTFGNVWDISINDHHRRNGFNEDNVKVCAWDQWQFDLPFDETKPETVPMDLWKYGTKQCWLELRRRYPNMVMYSQLACGRLSNTPDIILQAFREAELELVQELDWAYDFNAPATWGFDNNLGSAHYYAEDYTTMGYRLLWFDMEQRGIIDLHAAKPPVISSAAGVIGNTYVDVGITHYGSTDFTPTSGIEGFALLDADGEEVTITSQDRQDASTVRLTLDAAIEASDELNLYYIYGNNAYYSDNVNNCIKSNSARELPLMFVHDYSVSITDYIASLDNQVAYLEATDSSKTYSSGSNVSDIDTVSGTVSGFNISGTEPVFSTDHLVLDTDTILDYDTDYGATGNLTIMFAIETPSVLPAFGAFITFTNSVGTVTTSAQMYLRSNGTLVYSQNEAASNQTITTGIGASEKLIITLDFISSSSCNVYVNGHNTATLNFDPSDGYTSKVRVKVGGSQVDNGIGKLYGYLHTLDSLSAAEREGAFDAMNGRYGFGL